MKQLGRKILLFSLTVGIVASLTTPALALDNSTSTIELGNDQEFLTDVERQEKWIEESWKRIDEMPVVGDWKAGSRAVGTWSWRDGVICYTDSYSSDINHGHAGIVGVSPYLYSVVEANPNTGVAIRYGDWVSNYGTRTVQTGVTATTTQQDHNAAAWAVEQVGKPYGEVYSTGLSDRNKFYCSLLVYAAYKDTAGINLDTWAWPGIVHPMELVDNEKVTKIFDTN